MPDGRKQSPQPDRAHGQAFERDARRSLRINPPGPYRDRKSVGLLD